MNIHEYRNLHCTLDQARHTYFIDDNITTALHYAVEATKDNDEVFYFDLNTELNKLYIEYDSVESMTSRTTDDRIRYLTKFGTKYLVMFGTIFTPKTYHEIPLYSLIANK